MNLFAFHNVGFFGALVLLVEVARCKWGRR